MILLRLWATKVSVQVETESAEVAFSSVIGWLSDGINRIISHNAKLVQQSRRNNFNLFVPKTESGGEIEAASCQALRHRITAAAFRQDSRAPEDRLLVHWPEEWPCCHPSAGQPPYHASGISRHLVTKNH